MLAIVAIRRSVLRTMVRGPLLIWLCVACADSEGGVYFSDIGTPVVREPEQVDSLELGLVAEYGTADGPVSFSHIQAVAVHPVTRLLAVGERDGCRITLIDTGGGAFRHFGTCGGGPGEFREINHITFYGDTLVVFDRSQAVLVFMDLNGKELRRLRPEVLERHALELAGIGHFGGSLLLAGLGLQPVISGGTEREFLAVIDASTGETHRRWLADAPITRITRRPFLRGIKVCVSREGPVPVVAAENIWSTQVVTFRGADLRREANFATRLDWRQPEEQGEGTGRWGPPLPLPGIACGRDHVLVAYREQTHTPDGPLPTHAHLEVRRYDGTVVLSRTQLPPPGGVVYGTPIAAAGDRFYFYSNNLSDFPVVREYQLRRRAKEE